MLELPDAKRVRREDLRSPASSRASSPVTERSDTVAIDALRGFYSLETFVAPEDAPGSSHDQPQDAGITEQEFEFRLFHTPAAKNANTALSPQRCESREDGGGVQRLRIRVRSPTPDGLREGGFVVPFRGWDYYLSDPAAVMGVLNQALDRDGTHRALDIRGSRKSRFQGDFASVAVSGEDVLARAKLSWPGCHLPWRVIHLRSSSTAKSPSDADSPKPPAVVLTADPLDRKKKSKPGKKRRIALRKRLGAKKAEEAAEREKRARRNREKKLKRRQRERDKKAALKEAEGTTVTADEHTGNERSE